MKFLKYLYTNAKLPLGALGVLLIGALAVGAKLFYVLIGLATIAILINQYNTFKDRK
jgi:uncharacterized membrane protein YuzA (DUF378 family)